ncbi:MAG: rRNA maturation RNase YbeY [Sedimentisphaerales bacterium]|nr:rRNA maturation RNase YbeY [Sedimentisphaerales bacterium]
MASVRKKQVLVIRIAENFKLASLRLRKLKKLVKFVCNRFKLSKAIINIAIVNNAQMRKLNKQFLKRAAATDCLSFNLSDNKWNIPRGKSSAKSFELIVNGEMAVRQAKLRGHSSEAELALYITHGLLHNLGFDDSTKNKAEKMHNTEDEILRKLGYGIVYNSAEK